jgi:very-short-patch-repair endonuclease
MRTAELAIEDIRVVRVTNADVMQNFEGVCSTILRILDPKP